MSLLALLLVPTATAQEAPAEEEDFRSLLDQARFFLKKQWYQDALQQLEAAVATPDGRIDPDAWYLLASVRYELTDLPGAREAAARAQTYARTDEQLQAAANLSTYLTGQFGVVHVHAPLSGVASTLDIQLESILFDPDLKLYLKKIQERLASEKVLLPYAVGLPAGTYRIGDAQVTVEPGQVARAELSAASVRTKGASALKLAQLDLGVGLSLWFGERVANLGPGIELSMAFTQPVGPLQLTALATWTPRLYTPASGGTSVSTNGWSVGARVGLPFRQLDPVVFHVALGYRFGTLPGLELGCTADGASWSCAPDTTPDLVVYTVGRAHIPHAVVGVGYVRQTRGVSVGVGLRVGVDQAFGTVPAEATARVMGSEDTVDYAVPKGERAWSATGLRLVGHLTLAF